MTENRRRGTSLCFYSTREPVVALSSCETEYIAASLGACQAMWLMNLLKELGCNDDAATTLFVENVSAINLAKNPIAHGRSKHIEMRFHYLRELAGDGKLRLSYCRSEDQIADLLTTGVTNDVFKRLKKCLNMVDLKQLK